MKFAIIRCGGKQYRVSPGDVLKVESQGDSSGSVALGDVLAVGDEGGLNTAPAGVRVRATILGEGKAPKILVFHYKRKKQYKKLMGHRQRYTSVRVDAIEAEA